MDYISITCHGCVNSPPIVVRWTQEVAERYKLNCLDISELPPGQRSNWVIGRKIKTCLHFTNKCQPKVTGSRRLKIIILKNYKIDIFTKQHSDYTWTKQYKLDVILVRKCSDSKVYNPRMVMYCFYFSRQKIVNLLAHDSLISWGAFSSVKTL